MAEETESKSETKVAKKAKKTAVPEAPPEAKQALPTAAEIRTAKKAELIGWSERYGLSQEGKVDDLRKRLLTFIEKEAAKKAAPEEQKPEPPKAEKKPKEKPKEKVKPPKGKRGKEEAEEEAEEAVHEPRAKPKLEPHLKRLLAVRYAKNAARPKFRRQEWFRYRKFGDEWRKPQGGQSKLRRHFGYRWNLPSIGYRGPRRPRAPP